MRVTIAIRWTRSPLSGVTELSRSAALSSLTNGSSSVDGDEFR
jgi:hypothetical protein